MSARADVAIVGGGPAGSALAILLGRRGVRVLLLDRSRFPRDKICGEFMSPQALATLDRLGVLREVERAHPRKLQGLYLRSAGGSALRGDYVPVDGHVPYRAYGLGICRRTFDGILLRAAGNTPGVEVREGFCATRLLREGDRVVGLAGRRDGGPEEKVPARLVVGADGRRSAVARWAGLGRSPRGLRRFGLRAYFEGLADENRGELRLGPGCFAGIAPVDGGVANVNLVIDAAEAGAMAGDPDGYYDMRLSGIPGMPERLRGARRLTRVQGTGPLAWDTARPVADGVLLVGDAAVFVDPFTGEGIFMALRGADLAAAPVAEGLGSETALRRALAAYERARREEFALKVGACWTVQKLLHRRWLVDWAVGRLARSPRLARRVLAASGDYLPPEKVMGWPYWTDLVRPSFLGEVA